MSQKIGFLILGFAIIVNLYWLFPETKARYDVNDNVFAYSLALRTNEVWDTYCHPDPTSYFPCLVNLTDHWVDYWGQGYPLPHFYQHLPSIIFVAIYKLIEPILHVSLYTVFRWVQYLYLSIFPLTIYWAGRKFKLSPLTSSLAGLVSTLISTQFLYGTDLNAVTWRGSGMTTQLLGMVTLPLALGSIYETLTQRKNHARSAILLTLTFHMHLLFGFIASLSTLLLSLILMITDFLPIFTTNSPSHSHFISNFKFQISNLFKVLLPTVLLLAYWLVPLLQHNAYHNTSVWDDQAKFNSYGAKTVIFKFLSGDLFDANRIPVFTFLIFLSLPLCLSRFLSSRPDEDTLSFLYLPSLLLFWLLLYFGPTTWGNLFFLIPGTEGLHVHRLINGVHFAGIFLVAIALSSIGKFIVDKLSNFKLPFSRSQIILRWAGYLTSLVILAILLIPVYRERNDFMVQNKHLIEENHKLYETEKEDLETAIAKIQESPSRTNAGRPGNWGKKFTTGGSENFLHLSMAGIPTIGWLPQSWSPFSDIEQFWDEKRPDHYDLANVGWILSPLSQEVPKFGKVVYEGRLSRLISVPTSGNFHFITVPFAVFSHKNNVLNFDRLWLESNWPKAWSIPQIVFQDSNFKFQISNLHRPQGSPIDGPNLLLTDMDTFEGSGNRFNLVNSDLFGATPSALPQSAKVISGEKIDPHHYVAEVETGETLALMLKVTYHPYWQVRLDGKPTTKFMVAPAFMATPIPPGHHSVEFIYTVPLSKKLLLLVSVATLVSVLWNIQRNRS